MQTTLEHPHAPPAVPLTPIDAAGLAARVGAACEQACAAIAPAWPLDRSIAVNPHWARIAMPVRRVAARMAVLAGIQVFPRRADILQAWNERRIERADFARALATVPGAQHAGITLEHWLSALRRGAELPRLPLLIDVLDHDSLRHTRLSWRQAITHQVSQTCASYFDAQQADWRPERPGGLYDFWRDTLQHDHGIGMLMGIPDLARRLHALPATRARAEQWVLERLGLPPSVWPDYLEAVLLTVNGWASWCAYLAWQARLQGRHDEHLRELLAIRMAWGALVLEGAEDRTTRRAFSALQTAWSDAPAVFERAEAALVVDELGQHALEAAYQQRLARKLAHAATLGVAPADIEVQAAFCIDVRSEPLRRALEAHWPAVQTLGFAGFFGLPIAYTPLGTTATRPQLPGLLAPAIQATDSIDPLADETDGGHGGKDAAAAQARRDRFAWTDSLAAAGRWPGAAFSFVEAAGYGSVVKLADWLKPAQRKRTRDLLAGLPERFSRACRPRLIGLDDEAKVDLAARVLHLMGLDGALAPLVVLVGHGSQSANNAHAAALDCGACCGQTGEVNARLLARLLNEPCVRTGLRARGIAVPPDTSFVAALHNTTTDEIEWFDADALPPHAESRWQRLAAVFEHACDQVRCERAPRLGLDPRADAGSLLRQLQRRANDGAQTRPEWGLAGNAALIIAPRERTRGVVLDGRSFLHDYDASRDEDGSVLELLMTAPMVVAHWINWQYHASTCDPLHLGSGNKVLHNVVGGNIGVFEGNGGDLRIGLARQSLHDGRRWMHEPLRLTVIVDAPAHRIDTILAKHDAVAQLVNNGWLHLWRFEGADFQRYVEGRWE